MRKKLVSSICLCVLLAAAVPALFGCQDREETPTAQVIVALDKSEAEIEVYEEMTLTAAVENGGGAAVVWSSSDASVAAVDDKGNVRGVKAGSATVTASADGASAGCAIVVSDNGNLPYLDFGFSEIILNVGAVLPVNAAVKFKDSAAYGRAVIWSSDNPAVAATPTATPGTGQLTAQSAGSATVTATTAYGGYSVVKTLPVTVRASESILELGNLPVSGGAYALTLLRDKPTGTLEQHLNKTFLPQLLVNGDASAAVWSSSDAGVVSVNPSTGAITASGAGRAAVTASYADGDSNAHSLEIEVLVILPTVPIAAAAQTIEKTRNAAFILPEAARNGGITAVKFADSGENTLESYDGATHTVSLDETKLLPVKAALGKSVRVETPLAAYTFPIDVVTLVIATAADFDLMPSIAREEGGGTGNLIWDGYFILADDIVYNGTFNSFCGRFDSGNTGNASSSTGWVATFDGRGHYIKGLTLGAGVYSGLFGDIGAAGVVKNVAFVDGSVTYATIGVRYSSYLAWSNYGAVDNVFVSASIPAASISPTTIGTTLLPDGAATGATVRNVMAEILNLDSLPVWASAVWGTNGFQSVYAVGRKQEGYLLGGVGTFSYPAGLAYETVDRFAAAKASLDFTNFDASVWDLTTKIPVFKTHKAAFTPAESTKYNAR
ncbi:MAG: Ig-like domain-containing protein [Clostridiales bacterium]|jgi:uncharacterized protein YjdB|nr:Ig-like domain-containing protein [Clostridiales bacterium]